MRVMLHIPEMTELVVGTGDGPTGARGLHREAGDHQRGRETAKCFEIAGLHAGRVGHPVSKASLDHLPIGGIDWVDSQTVGQDPVGAGRALGYEVGVARGVESFRRSRDHFQVGGYSNRRRTIESVLGAIKCALA